MKSVCSGFLLISMSCYCFDAEKTVDTCSGLVDQRSINSCIESSLNAETVAINSLYNEYRAKLSADEKQKFKEVQLSWIKYKDQDCAFEGSAVKKGSMYVSAVNQCLIEQTKIRRKQLEALLRCDSGISPSCI